MSPSLCRLHSCTYPYIPCLCLQTPLAIKSPLLPISQLCFLFSSYFSVSLCCREGFTKEEAEKFVMTAAALAISKDGSSGGVLRTVTISETGAERKLYRGEDVPQFQDEVAPRMRGVMI